MIKGYDRDLDYLEEDSDQEGAESSDDDIDILLHGTPEQKRKLCQRSSGQESSSEDDFEKEMNKELNDRVVAIEAWRGSTTSDTLPGPSDEAGDATSDEPQKYYDDVYFDSDEEEMFAEGEARAKEKKKKLTNDELLYDPDQDDKDEQWINNHRRSYQPKSGNTTGKKKKVNPLPNSDAVLNCPACMTTLCLDCQRHDIYKNQYRAMFVMNCVVDTKEFLKYPKGNPKKNKHKKKKTSQGAETEEGEADDKFNPVKCTECNTVVAVYDKDEVYHFFNVLSSYG